MQTFWKHGIFKQTVSISANSLYSITLLLWEFFLPPAFLFDCDMDDFDYEGDDDFADDF